MPEPACPLLDLAGEAVAPALPGCAAELGGAVATLAATKAIDRFGPRIAQCWFDWFLDRPPEARAAALAGLAELPTADARRLAREAVDRAAPDAADGDRAVAAEYLAAIPRDIARGLVKDHATGGWSLAPAVSLDRADDLLSLLPADVPPYPVPCELAGTPYRLDALLGCGGFGAVYRASASSLQHLPLAIKFCLDPAMRASLATERANLERLMKAGGEGWSGRIVRLYGYDLDRERPYLVYEFVPGGDLVQYLARRHAEAGRHPTPAEALSVVTRVADALALAHAHGLIHRDLKPANVLVDGEAFKLADFGLGSVVAARAARVNRLTLPTASYLSCAEQASLFRGAGTPLYMSPEQRRGLPADPRHDLYSLGVMWFQLLVGDVTRELPPGWAKELAVKHGVPAAHIDAIERCVGYFDERPRDAAELLPLLKAVAGGPAAPVSAPPTPEAVRVRQTLLASSLAKLRAAHEWSDLMWRRPSWRHVLAAVLLAAVPGWLFGEAMYTALHPNLGFGNSFGSVRPDPLAIVLGIVFGLAVAAGLTVWFWRRAWRSAGVLVNDRAEHLCREFPAEVESWGGPAVLRDGASVAEVVGRLAPPAPASRPPLTAEAVQASPVLKEVLIGHLFNMRTALKSHKETHDGSIVLLSLGLLVGVPVAGFGGHAATYKAVSGVIDEAPAAVFCALAAVLATAAVVAVVVSLTLWVRRSADAALDKQVRQLTDAFGPLIDGWGGEMVLRNTETLSAAIRGLGGDPEAKSVSRMLGRAVRAVTGG